ncbi:hypothetical protein H1R20_g12780, partial [Candolleomyces eurysporus]
MIYIDQSSANYYSYYNSQNQTTTKTTNSNNDNSTRARNSSLNGYIRSMFQAERIPSRSYPPMSTQYSPAGRMDYELPTRAPEFELPPSSLKYGWISFASIRGHWHRQVGTAFIMEIYVVDPISFQVMNLPTLQASLKGALVGKSHPRRTFWPAYGFFFGGLWPGSENSTGSNGSL